MWRAIRNFFRWRRFVRRLRSTLPAFNPKTGQPIEWDISLQTKGSYDRKTGRLSRSGLSTLCVRQRAPSLIPLDSRVYVVVKGEMRPLPLVRWC